MKHYKVAILDMHDGHPNQGMRCIKEIVSDFEIPDARLEYHVYDVRGKSQLPNIDQYDIYVSSGGPGSPFEGHGKEWEKQYFILLEKLWDFNQNNANLRKKHFFFICYSYQMMCRFFNLAVVSNRKATSFGIFPVHKTEGGKNDWLLNSLPDPYFAVDSRDWQLVQPHYENIVGLGARVLSLEKLRPHVDFERALMAIRVSDEWVGTQFHPEAEAFTMGMYFQQEEKKQQIVENYGEKKFEDMITHLNDPEKIILTHNTILPNFLRNAIAKLEMQETIFSYR